MDFLRFLVSGRVQGVGFRDYTCKKARQIGLKGWVRNLTDGRVEVLAYGAEEDLLRLEELLKRGPISANVLEVCKNHEKLRTQLSDEFEIRFGEG